MHSKWDTAATGPVQLAKPSIPLVMHAFKLGFGHTILRTICNLQNQGNHASCMNSKLDTVATASVPPAKPSKLQNAQWSDPRKQENAGSTAVERPLRRGTRSA